jgi:hypothetical protein
MKTFWQLLEEMKVTKESVDYSKGMPESHCGICDHYKSPNACERVKGKINTNMWCKLFKKED